MRGPKVSASGIAPRDRRVTQHYRMERQNYPPVHPMLTRRHAVAWHQLILKQYSATFIPNIHKDHCKPHSLTQLVGPGRRSRQLCTQAHLSTTSGRPLCLAKTNRPKNAVFPSFGQNKSPSPSPVGCNGNIPTTRRSTLRHSIRLQCFLFYFLWHEYTLGSLTTHKKSYSTLPSDFSQGSLGEGCC